MSEPTPHFSYEKPSNRRKTGAIIAAFLLLAAANVYLFMRVSRLQVRASTLQTSLDSEMVRVQESRSLQSGQTRRELEALRDEIQKTLNESTNSAKKHARNETAWLAKNVSKQQRQQQEQIMGEIRGVDGKTIQTQQRVEEVSGVVDTIKTEVDTTQSQLAQTHEALSQTVGHLGAMNDQIAGNQSSIADLRKRAERERIEFQLSKSKLMQRVGNVHLRLKNTDAKRNRYTLEVLADDRKVVKKEKTVNEPVQFYVSGSNQPYEIVITQVTKDRVTGYLATPKGRTARG